MGRRGGGGINSGSGHVTSAHEIVILLLIILCRLDDYWASYVQNIPERIFTTGQRYPDNLHKHLTDTTAINDHWPRDQPYLLWKLFDHLPIQARCLTFCNRRFADDMHCPKAAHCWRWLRRRLGSPLWRL